MDKQISHLIVVNGVFYTIESVQYLIQLNICSYDILKKQVNSESRHFILPVASPSQSVILDICNKTGNPNISSFVSLESAMSSFDSFLSSNYIDKKLNYGIVYQDDKVLSVLPPKAKIPNICFNIYTTFNSFYKTNLTSLDDMLSKLNLKPESKDFALKDYNSMVRVINKMIKDGKGFYKEKEKTETLPSYIKPYYIRMKNFPSYITKKDILDLFYQFEIPEDDIALAYDIFGRKTGDVTVRTYNERNQRELITMFKFYYFNNENIIEIVDSNENDFNACLKSENFVKSSIYESGRGKSQKIAKIFVKMSKITSSVREEDIKVFFKNYTISENGIKMNKYRKGNPTGEAVIAFINENECKDVISRENGRLLMNQLITLEQSDIDKFEEYAASNAFSNWIKCLSEYITSEEVQRSLFIANLPLDATKEAIVNHLQLFNVNESNLIINNKILSENGSLIIKFSNEDDANDAKSHLLKTPFEWKGRKKNLSVENLLFVVNKGNEN